MADEQAMSKRIGVIADTFQTHVHFCNTNAGDAQVMVDLDQLRREFPDQARTDEIRRAQTKFRQCMQGSWTSRGRATCRAGLIGALDYLRM